MKNTRKMFTSLLEAKDYDAFYELAHSVGSNGAHLGRMLIKNELKKKTISNKIKSITNPT